MSIVTNTRLLELRAMRDGCLEAIDDKHATKLAQDYVDLYDIVEDLITTVDADGVTAAEPKNYAILIGK